MRSAAIAAMFAAVAAGWDQLPSLPRAISGQCAGVSNGALLVIGGSYFPTPLFEGGKKTWVDTIYVLTPGASAWKTFHTTRPIGYAACVTAPGGVVVAAGGDAEQNFREVRRLSWANDAIATTALPDLPVPLANAAATLVDGVMYVAGGQSSPAATEASRALYALDLRKTDAGWRRLEDCPGSGRILPVFGSAHGDLYLASGAELTPNGRVYLKDAWRFRPGGGWKRMADAPHAMVAAPVLSAGGAIYVFGGDDGENAGRIQELKDKHPGFRRTILAWTPAANRWSSAGDYAAGLVTTMATQWGNKVVIAGGEDRPGHRSASVIALPKEELR